MTIKLLLLKSGEDMIASVAEMGYGEGEDRRVVGYYLNKPCVIKMRDPNVLDDESEGRGRKACLLYTSPSPRDRTRSRMPSSA